MYRICKISIESGHIDAVVKCLVASNKISHATSAIATQRNCLILAHERYYPGILQGESIWQMIDIGQKFISNSQQGAKVEFFVEFPDFMDMLY